MRQGRPEKYQKPFVIEFDPMAIAGRPTPSPEPVRVNLSNDGEFEIVYPYLAARQKHLRAIGDMGILYGQEFDEWIDVGVERAWNNHEKLLARERKLRAKSLIAALTKINPHHTISDYPCRFKPIVWHRYKSETAKPQGTAPDDELGSGQEGSSLPPARPFPRTLGDLTFMQYLRQEQAKQ